MKSTSAKNRVETSQPGWFFRQNVQSLGMTKSLTFTLLMVSLTFRCFGQDDPALDCQDPSACFSNVDFSFDMGALEQDSIEVPFWNDVIGISVQVNWAGGGTSYPGDLSLSLCSPSGECVTISGLDLSLIHI